MVYSLCMRIPIPAIVIPVVFVSLYLFLPGIKELPWTSTRIVGAILAITGFVLVGVSRLQLGRSFSVQPKASTLVTHGLYKRISHPIYVFADVMLAGLILVFTVYWLFFLLLVLMTIQAIQARREFKVLHDAFGPAYIDYRNRTWF
ncbi:MAG: hypothetical protein JWP63_6588 [Candidatus Solibacter sp.]|nr:hypothetical protein [Candidatus Solibacter sp.]